MIREMTWDSTFFRKRIGRLLLTAHNPQQIESVLGKAKLQGFQYIVCKITSFNTSSVRLLESFGFSLTDVGVTYSIKANDFNDIEGRAGLKISNSIKVASTKDIPMLKKMVQSLFTDSRFYNDPFFTKKDADSLYKAWIENSVRGIAADVVFCIPHKGFICCKQKGKKQGEIILIGVDKKYQGQGLGRALIEKAVKWFIDKGLPSVSVRTQLKNVAAMNFYTALGFSIKKYDVIFSKIL